jgi:NTP pyrophosphatase (non-canonical NTP hydrolase)
MATDNWSEEERNKTLHTMRAFILEQLDEIATYVEQKDDDEDIQATIGAVQNAVHAMIALGDRRLIPDNNEVDTIMYATELVKNRGGK